MSRRAFTVLEVVLAAALGAVVALACVGLMGALDRFERAGASASEDLAALVRLRTVMERTFGSLLLSESASGAAAPVGMRARVRLESAGLRDRPPQNTVPVQRLEVVVTRSPVPPGLGGSPLRDTMWEGQEGEVLAVRGVFEVRPDGPQAGTWSVWWRPLPPAGSPDLDGMLALEPTRDPRAVRLARGLTQCQWLAFQKRQRRAELEVWDYNDVPAHMECHVRTARGQWAQWMFEVAWRNGAESAAEARLGGQPGDAGAPPGQQERAGTPPPKPGEQRR